MKFSGAARPAEIQVKSIREPLRRILAGWWAQGRPPHPPFAQLFAQPQAAHFALTPLMPKSLMPKS
jgi:hypothetical protein